MGRLKAIILGTAAAASLALLGVYSAIDRAERAREERVDWPRVSSLATSTGYAAAEAFLDERLAQHPNDALLHYYRARLSYEQGLSSAALAGADRAIALGYAQEISHLLKALVYGRQLGDRRAQLALASKAVAYDPTYSEGYLVRAEAEYELGDYRACAADAASYARMEPKSADGHEFSMLCLDALGDPAGAERAGLAVLERRPNSHAALWRLGRIYAARAEHERAFSNFTEAIRLSGGRAGYYMDRSASCGALGDYACEGWDYAAAMAWQSLSAYPTHYLRLASALYRAAEVEEALAAAEKAVAGAPSAAAYELRGRLKAESGDLDGGRRDFAAAAALDPALSGLASALPSGPAKKKKRL